jgi:hypothetical protein
MPPLLLEYSEAAILASLLVGAALWRPRFPVHTRLWSWAGAHPFLTAGIMGAIPVIIRLLLLPVYSVPIPFIHDEFSMLFTAQTFALGRLTNQAHPFARHFETLYVFREPTWNGTYPPGTPAFLALGMLLTSNPWMGVLLSNAILFAVIYWALRGCLPVRWAIFGTLIALSRVTIVAYWMNGYWGGAAPAIGGALVAGAVVRLTKRICWKWALVLGAGFFILVNTRPFEAVVIAIPVIVFLSWIITQDRGLSLRSKIYQLGPSLISAALVTAGFTLYYNCRVTGDYLTIPYAHHRVIYGVPQTFLFQKPLMIDVGSLRTPEQKTMYLWQLQSHEDSARHPWLFIFDRSIRMWIFICGIALTLPALYISFVLRRQKGRAANVTLFAICAANILGVYVYGFFNTHFLAPSLAAIALLLTNGMRYLSADARRIHRSGPAIVAVLLLCSLAKMFVPVGANILSRALPGAAGQRVGRLWIVSSYKAPEWAEFRESIIHEARTRGERRIILVRYSDSHDFGEEWVYNDPTPEDAAVVWARDLGAAQNALLLRYFSRHSAWLLDADHHPPQLSPYPPGSK